MRRRHKSAQTLLSHQKMHTKQIQTRNIKGLKMVFFPSFLKIKVMLKIKMKVKKKTIFMILLNSLETAFCIFSNRRKDSKPTSGTTLLNLDLAITFVFFNIFLNKLKCTYSIFFIKFTINIKFLNVNFYALTRLLGIKTNFKSKQII